ncbi:unnamed protein product [Urochloa humidicola]
MIRDYCLLVWMIKGCPLLAIVYAYYISPVLPLPSRRTRRAQGLNPLLQTVLLLQVCTPHLKAVLTTHYYYCNQVPIDAESLLVGVSIEDCMISVHWKLRDQLQVGGSVSLQGVQLVVVVS